MDKFISESVVKNENPAIAMGVTGKQHLSTVYLMDCIEGMKQYRDNFFDLAVVDPPYGIKINMNMGIRKQQKKRHSEKKWDNSIPPDVYFKELFRVSKNQIIWGGNYFKLKLTKSWIFWDKNVPQGVSFADGELAWTSFDKNLLKVKIDYSGFVGMDHDGRIHPTQKPIKLYDWIFANYAKPGDIILDTHLGSQSSRIAACKAGLPFIGFENDQEYFDLGNKRFYEFARQGSFF